MTTRPRARSRALFVLAALALGSSCRQTVILDPGERDDGGGGTTGAAGSDGGFDFDAILDGFPRPDGPRSDGRPTSFCQGGQITPLVTTMRIPDVVFIVDRSSATQAPFGASTRLALTQQTIAALIQKYQRVVHFGYEEFPATSSNCGNGNGCCAGDVIPPAPSTASAIDRVMHRCDGNPPGCAQSGRPLTGALDKAYGTFSAFPNSYGSRYLIALLGGDPTCQSADASASSCADSADDIAKLSRNGVRSAIFGVGADAAGSECLDQLATLGGLQINATSPLYHFAKTPLDLATQLDPLVKTMAEEACHIDIRTPAMDPDKVSVLFDGKPIEIDPANGWTFDLDSTVGLTLHGSACETMITNGPRVEVVGGCMSPHH
jgi:hypothetical protein